MGSVWPRGAVFWLLGYVFGYVALLVVALALSSALYLVAEYAEEFPSFAGKVIKYSLVLVLSLHLLLWFDGMPWFESVVGIACNVCYASMLSTFPFVEILSVRSIASALAFLAAHYIWFSYFLNSGSDILHVVGFFVVMVWFVPGGLFVSLAINDNVLPGVSGSKLGAGAGGGVGGGGSQKGTNLFKTLFDFVQERAVPACINAWNAVASRAGQTSTRITGGGAYGRQKKGEDYVNSANDGHAYGGGVGGGGGGGGGGYGGGSSIYQQQPQYQQQQQQQYQQYQQQPQQQSSSRSSNTRSSSNTPSSSRHQATSNRLTPSSPDPLCTPAAPASSAAFGHNLSRRPPEE